jgi:hypothetical protein
MLKSKVLSQRAIKNSNSQSHEPAKEVVVNQILFSFKRFKAEDVILT